MWSDRDLEEQNVYDHQKENGGVLVGVPSMEEMENDEAAAAVAAAGSHPIHAGLHELTPSASTAGTNSHMQHDHSSNSLITGNGGPSVLDPHSHQTLAMDHRHYHNHQVINILQSLSMHLRLLNGCRNFSSRCSKRLLRGDIG